MLIDMRTIDLARFPNIVSALNAAGFDPAHEPVPVAPAAHYTMGGVATDLEARSSLPGLLAVGECGCTGLHGANRLASNSLAECFVFGHRAAHAALAEPELPAALGPRRPSPDPRPCPRRDAQRPLAAGGHRARRRGTRAARERPVPAGPADRPLGARPRGEPRRPPAQRPPQTDPALDSEHLVVAQDGSARLVTWS